MKYLFISMFITLSGAGVPVNISGKLVGEIQNPAANCKVSLSKSTLQGTPVINGEFNITGTASTQQQGKPYKFIPDLGRTKLYVTVAQKSLRFVLGVYNVKGKLVSQPLRITVGEGSHGINLKPLIEHLPSSSLYFLKVSAEGNSYTHKLYLNSHSQIITGTARSAEPTVLARTGVSNVVDTLKVSCNGYSERKITVDNYTQDVGTINISRPNIVLMMVDDMGYSDIGSFGSEIQTPNLDKLASEGLRFRQFYNAAKCEPTRASLLSGLDWHVSGLGIKNGITMGDVMQAAGYSTMTVGKWHVAGTPEDRGFDRAFGHLSGASQFFSTNETFHLDGKPYSKPADDDDWYLTDVNTDYAMQFIEEEKKKFPDKPFFLYYAPNAPHNPLQAPHEDIMKYRGKYKAKGWDVLRQERYERQLASGLFDAAKVKLSNRSDGVPAWETLSEAHRDIEDSTMSIYAAMIDRLDQNIGRMLKKLEDLGVLNNTLILFHSDNGANGFTYRYGNLGEGNWGYGAAWANLSNTPYRLYKRNVHQGGACSPLIAWWPGVITQRGEFSDYKGQITDLMTTFIDAGNWTYPGKFSGKDLPPLPGKSLLPLFEGKSLQPHEAIYLHRGDHLAVIAGDWKLVKHNGNPWELYRLDVDLSETNNLVNIETAKAKELEALWNGYVKSHKVVVDDSGELPVYEPHK